MGFATVDLLYTLTNLTEIALVIGIIVCGVAFCWLGCIDYRRQRDEERRQRHPSASNVTVIRPPFDWAVQDDYLGGIR
jgi:hypothetical protein